MPDAIQKLGRSLIQHGSDSDRIYLMKLDSADVATIVLALIVEKFLAHRRSPFAAGCRHVKSAACDERELVNGP